MTIAKHQGLYGQDAEDAPGRTNLPEKMTLTFDMTLWVDLILWKLASIRDSMHLRVAEIHGLADPVEQQDGFV